jgi:hypothetical protein
MLHRHHIIPKHAGGGNEPSNIKKLTVEEHALEHKKLYEKYKRPEDKVAWLALSGQLTKEESLSIGYKIGREKTDSFLKEKYGEDWRSKLGKKANESLKEKIKNNKKFAEEMLNSRRANIKLAHISANTEQAKEKKRNTFKRIKHQQGTKNNQYGTMWITNKKENKKINKTDHIPDGWIKGRTL